MNRTPVVLLQHRRERSHPFNTARIVSHALDRCTRIVDYNQGLSRRFEAMPLHQNVGLLFPGDDARLLSELPPGEHPMQLVIPDGTWNHVKTLMREVPRLQTLPRYRLEPAVPSRYRIRREPDAHGLSTLEATVAALEAIEPETEGLDRLLLVMDRMISEQIEHGTSNWRHNERRRRGLPNIPRVLSGDLSRIVVAYGEQERGMRHERGRSRSSPLVPIYWTAIRLISRERFECAIQSPTLADAEFMKLLRLSPEQTHDAVPLAGFRDRWKSFLRPQDQVVVYHPTTAKLLDSVHRHTTATLNLKSIAIRRDEPAGVAKPGGLVPESLLGERSRASERLASAVAFVELLRTRL